MVPQGVCRHSTAQNALRHVVMAIQFSESLHFLYTTSFCIPLKFCLWPALSLFYSHFVFHFLLPILERAPSPGRTIISTIVFFCHENFSNTCYVGYSLFYVPPFTVSLYV